MVHWIIANWEKVIEILGAAYGFLLVMIKFYNKVIKGTVAWFRKLNTAIAEVSYDSGGSMKDMISQATAQLWELAKEIAILKTGQSSIIAILDLPVWYSDSEGKITDVSAAMCDLCECTKEELLDLSGRGIVAEFDRERVVKAWEESVKYASEFTLEHSIHLNNGYFQKIKPVVVHQKDHLGKVVSSIGRIIKIGEPYKL